MYHFSPNTDFDKLFLLIEASDVTDEVDMASSSTVRIVIVGAGVSGLTCARRLTYLLKKRPHKITVLEARDRIGGRTFSIPELNLDLGASWIFSDHIAVRTLARELNISTFEQYESGVSLIDTQRGGIQPTIMNSIHGDAKRLRGGTGNLCTAMFTELTTRNEATVTVQLSSPVTHVTCEDNGVIVVTLDEHRSISADYLVLALPPKLLIATVKLTPTLPLSHIKQLTECVTWMASTCKAILLYERAWWRDQKLSGFAVSRQSKAQEWHDASSETCNALFVFCLAGTTKQQIIDDTIRMFGSDAINPTTVHMTDWSSEVFTSSSTTDGKGGHPHVSNICRQPYWNGRLWLGNSEMSDSDGGFLEGAVRRGTQVADQLAALVATNETIA
jgi:monoamine oxidase